MIRQEDIRPGHQNWRWTAGSRITEVDPNGFAVRVADGLLEFTCDGCGVNVSGPTPEVQALMAFHLTTDPTNYTKGIFT
ncbi:MAG TPA: hypothetical protein VFU47_16795 [Armatimonadota bacterium]|nr:hypothetical protein [Armatimonadota bacterium]